MRFSKTLTLAVSTSVLVGTVVAYANQYTGVTEKPSVTLKSRIPEYLDMNNPVMQKLEEAYSEISELQALYEDLSSNYAELQASMDKLLTKPVFNSQDVSVVSHVNVYQMKHALEGTELYSLANTFVEAEKTYSINAFFLAGLVAVESGWGTSARAINDNNMSGYAVYNDNSVGKKFVSKEASIMETARLIAEDYLPEGSKYHTGKSVYDINQLYSADSNWNLKISNIANELSNKAKMWGVE